MPTTTRRPYAGTIDAQRSGRRLTLAIRGRFDFSVHQDFRNKAADLAGLGEVTIDLRETSYLDSSALGMLLLLHDACTAVNITPAIVGCNKAVRQVLEVASFQQLFSIT